MADATLLQAAQDVVAGQHDADLGGSVFKQRVAREGGGKSGGFRTIILFRVGGHSFFAHGFAKNDKTNVSAKELIPMSLLAHRYGARGWWGGRAPNQRDTGAPTINETSQNCGAPV